MSPFRIIGFIEEPWEVDYFGILTKLTDFGRRAAERDPRVNHVDSDRSTRAPKFGSDRKTLIKISHAAGLQHLPPSRDLGAATRFGSSRLENQ
ncbi:hypothetical protein F01_680001 [Burkholderia cenocepacia]|nr:hypothetical protein F01_680001 [Burkholderia cenocepacia]